MGTRVNKSSAETQRNAENVVNCSRIYAMELVIATVILVGTPLIGLILSTIGESKAREYGNENVYTTSYRNIYH